MAEIYKFADFQPRAVQATRDYTATVVDAEGTERLYRVNATDPHMAGIIALQTAAEATEGVRALRRQCSHPDELTSAVEEARQRTCSVEVWEGAFADRPDEEPLWSEFMGTPAAAPRF